MFVLRMAALACVAIGVSSCVENEAPGTPPKLSPEVQLTSKGKSMPIERIAAVRLQPAVIDTVGAHKDKPVHTAVCRLKAETFTLYTEQSGVYYLPAYGAKTPPVEVNYEFVGRSVTQTFPPKKTTTRSGGKAWSYETLYIVLSGNPYMSNWDTP